MEVIMIVSKHEDTPVIFEAIVKAAKLDVLCMGFDYVIPILSVAGLVPLVPAAT
ncbi:MAG: hypothetical protein WCS96_01570 [Victivallales bacterium]